MGMARRMSKRTKNSEPAVMTLNFPLPNFGLTNTAYIDLSQCASLANRRFYRQGLNWAVAGFTLHTTETGALEIASLPQTWVMGNSWEKSMRAWLRMSNDALSEAESVRPRFMDFKTYMDSEHHVKGFGDNLKPASSPNMGTWSFATPGEWEPSKIYLPQATNAAAASTTDAEFTAVGASYAAIGASGLSSVSMIEGYANSRSLPNIADPNTPDDAADVSGSTPENWMSAIFNDGNTQTAEVVEDMIGDNDIAPYPFENDGVNLDTMYPGGATQLEGLQWHDQLNATTSTVSGKVTGRGGTFPCGLIKIQYDSSLAESGGLYRAFLQVHLVPGQHRGYLAESMTEM
jgi:hypothetical protein